MRTEYDSLYFGGRWLPASTGERITVVSPHTAQAIGSTPCATEQDVDRAGTGMVGINGFAPDLWSPYGGYKQSDIGREYGPVGLDTYLEHKSIYGAP